LTFSRNLLIRFFKGLLVRIRPDAIMTVPKIQAA
jgi:hypothetical protein